MPRGRFETTAPRTARMALAAVLTLVCLALGACGEPPTPEDRTARLTGDNGSVLDTSSDARDLQATAHKLQSRVKGLPRSATAAPLGPVAPPPAVVVPTTQPVTTTKAPIGSTTTTTTTKPAPPPYAVGPPEGLTCTGGTLSFTVTTNDLARLKANPGVVKVDGIADIAATGTIDAGKVRIEASGLPDATALARWSPKDLAELPIVIDPACTP